MLQRSTTRLSTLIVLNQKANESMTALPTPLNNDSYKENAKQAKSGLSTTLLFWCPRLAPWHWRLVRPNDVSTWALGETVFNPSEKHVTGCGNMISADKSIGPLESSTPTGNSRIKNVLPGDIIVAINNNQILQNTIPMALMTLTMISQMSMMNKKGSLST